MSCAGFARALLILLIPSPCLGQAQSGDTHILNRHELAKENFGADAAWYEQKIPFLDISDPAIKRVYYYRWQLYKAHLRDVGPDGYIVTEFLDRVSWDHHPLDTINDSAAFHIYEGRWLRDPFYMDSEITAMYPGGGNNRRYTEWLADATYARSLVTGDFSQAIRYLPLMERVYDAWNDHFDQTHGLYWIEPLFDATEYTIASIDASGGTDGFTGGQSYRPSINSYMYANARAISSLAQLACNKAVAELYAGRADELQRNLKRELWNPQLKHFTDRYEITNGFVRKGDFIRGRELVGFAPWYLHVLDGDSQYDVAWMHLLSKDELSGPFGMRTNEPSYQYFMRQYRYDKATGKPECQWNGPSWPFQTAQVLTGMANALNDSSQRGGLPFSASDYLRLFGQYTQLHFLNGKLDLQEDYDAQTGKPIVGLPRSHHYNHSTYVDLIISGLLGLRPRADDLLEVNPLLPESPKDFQFISYFCLEGVPYHGHLVTILFDADGKRYGEGAGLSVFVDGRRLAHSRHVERLTAKLPASPSPLEPQEKHPIDLAVNVVGSGYPQPSASADTTPSDLYGSIDGRVWFFPEAANGWSTAGSENTSDWYSIDLGQPILLGSARLFFYADGKQFASPAAVNLQYWNGKEWQAVPVKRETPRTPIANGPNSIVWEPITSSRMRLLVTHLAEKKAVRLIEVKLFAPQIQKEQHQ